MARLWLDLGLAAGILLLATQAFAEEGMCVNAKTAREELECLAAALAPKLTDLVSTETAIVAKLKWPSGDAKSERFKQANLDWRQAVASTCDVLPSDLHEGGSLAKSKSVRCRLQMYDQRNRLLQYLYRSTLNN